MNIYKYMMLAKNESMKSEYYQKVGSVITKGNKVISTGFNQIRYCSTGIRYTPWDNSIHAERDACRKVCKDNLKGCYIFIYRELKNGKTALSKPCPGCLQLLKDMKFKRIYYSIDRYPYYKRITL